MIREEHRHGMQVRRYAPQICVVSAGKLVAAPRRLPALQAWPAAQCGIVVMCTSYINSCVNHEAPLTYNCSSLHYERVSVRAGTNMDVYEA